MGGVQHAAAAEGGDVGIVEVFPFHLSPIHVGDPVGGTQPRMTTFLKEDEAPTECAPRAAVSITRMALFEPPPLAARLVGRSRARRDERSHKIPSLDPFSFRKRIVLYVSDGRTQVLGAANVDFP